MAGIITDSLGRRWDPNKHPRDRKGRFIRTFHKVRLFNTGGTKPWGVGRVDKINDEGHIDIEVTALARNNPESADHKIGEKYSASADNLESVNEKASLSEPARTNKLPDHLMALFGWKSADSDPDNPYPGLLYDLQQSREPFDGSSVRPFREDRENLFIPALERAGLDPNTDPDAPDGLPALQPLIDKQNSDHPLPNGWKEVLPTTLDRQFEAPDGSITRGVVLGAGDEPTDAELLEAMENDPENWVKFNPEDGEEGFIAMFTDEGEDTEEPKADLAPETPTQPTRNYTEDEFLAALEELYDDDETVLEEGEVQELIPGYIIEKPPGSKDSTVTSADGEEIVKIPDTADAERLQTAAAKIHAHQEENSSEEEPAPVEEPESGPPAEEPEPEPEGDTDTEEIWNDLTETQQDEIWSLWETGGDYEYDADKHRDLVSRGLVTHDEEDDTVKLSRLGADLVRDREPREVGSETEEQAPTGTVQERFDAMSETSQNWLVEEGFLDFDIVHEDSIPGPVTADLLDAGFIEIQEDRTDSYRLTNDGYEAFQTELARRAEPELEEERNERNPTDEDPTDIAPEEEALPEDEGLTWDTLTEKQYALLSGDGLHTPPEDVSPELEELEEEGLVEIDRHWVGEDHYEGFNVTLTAKGEEERKNLLHEMGATNLLDIADLTDEELDTEIARLEGLDPNRESANEYTRRTEAARLRQAIERRDGGAPEPEAAPEPEPTPDSDTDVPDRGGDGPDPLDALLDEYENAPSDEERIDSATEAIEWITSIIRNPDGDFAGLRRESKEAYLQRYRWRDQAESNAKWHHDPEEFPVIEAWMLEEGVNPKNPALNKFMVDEKGPYRYIQRGAQTGQKIHIGDKVAVKFKQGKKTGLWYGTVSGFFGDSGNGGKIEIQFAIPQDENDENGWPSPSGRGKGTIDYDNVFAADGLDPAYESGRVLEPEIRAPEGLSLRDQIDHFLDSWIGSDNQDRFSRLDGNEKLIFSNGYYLQAREDGDPLILTLHAPDGRVVDEMIDVPGYQEKTIKQVNETLPGNPTHKFTDSERFISGVEKIINDDEQNPGQPPAPEPQPEPETPAPDTTLPLPETEAPAGDTTLNAGRNIDDVVPDPGQISPDMPDIRWPSNPPTDQEIEDYIADTEAWKRWREGRLALEWRAKAEQFNHVFDAGITLPIGDPDVANSGANRVGAPNHTHNCFNCVTAWAARMHGYDVEAAPYSQFGPDAYTIEDVVNRFYNPEGSAADTVAAYAGIGNRKPDLWLSDFEKELRRLYGVGSWGVIAVKWKNVGGKDQGGHILAFYIKEDGTVVFYEPQSEKVYSGDDPWRNMSPSFPYVFMARLDNLPPPTGEGLMARV